MNGINLQFNRLKNKYIVYYSVIFVFVILPALILAFSVYRYFQISEEQNVLYLKSNINRISNELRNNLSSEKFFCRYFYDYYLSELYNNNDSDIKKSSEFCKKLKNFFGDNIDFVVLDNNGFVDYNSNPEKYNYSQKEWSEALLFSKSSINIFHQYINYRGHKNDEVYISHEGIKSARKILGSRLNNKSYYSLFRENDFGLIYADYSGAIPPSAVYDSNWGGLFVFISRELLKDTVHLKYCILDYLADKKLIAGLYNIGKIDDNFWVNRDVKDIFKLKLFINEHDSLGNIIETDYFYFCNQFLTKDKRFFVISEKSNSFWDVCLKTFLVFVFYLILSMPIIKYFWNTIIQEIPGKASIRLKLGFLFLFATGIPLLSLAVISHEYQLNKKLALIGEAKTWTADNILEIEQRYLTYLSKIRIDLEKYLDKCSAEIKTDGLSIDFINNLKTKLTEYNAWDFFCIASETSTIGTLEGLVKYNGTLDNIAFDEDNSILNGKLSEVRLNQLSIINIMIKKLCCDLNNKTVSGKAFEKFEVFSESVMQKSFPEIIYSIANTKDSINEFGFGTYTNMSYFKFISIFDKKLTDYVFLITWLPQGIQNEFIKKTIPETNRNPNNYKLLSFNKRERKFFPDYYNGNYSLLSFVRRASEKPTDEIEIIRINDEDYLAVSILGQKLSEFAFVGLFPLRNIDSIVSYKCYILWVLGVFCLLLAISLAQLLSKSFVNPMLNLQKGALAIENRNFDHRIPNLGNDEFGQVEKIFNNMMVGLKELEVARIVQESMFPKPEFKQGNFSVYGKSITMIDVGGDYLDFFKVDDSSFSVLLGDVAGHGLGAAVIMAMAKAAILSAGESLKSPSAMLNQIHKIILAMKTSKQKKIMTFQYLYINSNTGENLYGNAGACSPFLVRHSENLIEEVKVPGAALGAFKKASYKEKPLDLRPGDALVFYTDGIVECKNKNGEMLGYDNLKNTILHSWDSNPEIFYNNILNAYYSYVGADAEAGDDLTFVILMFNHSDKC